MTPAFDLTAILTSAATTLTAQIGSAAGVAIPVGVAVLAIGVGWRLFKRFAKG